MKWFHHDADIRHKESITKLKEEFGFEGIGRYWTICEIIAEQMDFTEKCFAEFPEKKWLSELAIRRPLFSRYLVVIGQLFDNRVITNGSLIRIEMPNLLEKKDNHTRNLQAKLKKLASIDKDIEIEKEKDKRPSATFDQEYGFEVAWKAYKRKLGRKEACRHYKTSVKSVVDHNCLMEAMDNYYDYVDAMGYDYQHGSTWFNNWQDHLTPHIIKPKKEVETHFEKNRNVIDDWAASEPQEILEPKQNVIEK